MKAMKKKLIDLNNKTIKKVDPSSINKKNF